MSPQSGSNRGRKTAKDLGGFYWQRGYGAFSVSPSHVDPLVQYIKRQQEHHKQESFKDELRRLCAKYELEIDERYVSDLYNAFGVFPVICIVPRVRSQARNPRLRNVTPSAYDLRCFLIGVRRKRTLMRLVEISTRQKAHQPRSLAKIG